MRKFISVFLVLSLLLGCMIVPASALDVDDYGLINLMDYGYFNATSSYSAKAFSVDGYRVTCRASDPTFTVEFMDPGIYKIGSYSMLVMTDSTEISIGIYQVTISATPFENVYLLQGGALSFTDLGEYISLNVTMDGSYIEFINFFVEPNFETIASVGVSGYNLTTGYYFETTPGGSFSEEFYGTTSDMYDSIRFQFTPVAEDGSYEYFDLHLAFTGVYINSISVLQGDKALDYAVTASYYDGNGTLVTKSGNGLNDALSETVSDFWISIKVYCPDAALIEGRPYIFIDCATHNAEQSIQYSMSIFPAYVSIGGAEINGIFAWFKVLLSNLGSWFGNLFDLLSSLTVDDSTGEGAEFATEASGLGDKFDSVNDSMSSMERPEISESDIDPGIIVPSDDVVYATSPLTVVMNNGTIKDVFMLALIFIFAGYIIYGKR